MGQRIGKRLGTLAFLPVIALTASSMFAAPASAGPPTTRLGAVQGTLTSQGGAPLNGMCVNLYAGHYATGNPITTAPTGTTGTAGFFTQANVPAGSYVALFWNCGANVSGNPDPNYVDIFYGNTYVPSAATKFRVTAHGVTDLGTNLIPLGGTISGNVQDATAGTPAIYGPAVGILIPHASAFNITGTQGWYIVCSDSGGNYSITGVPTGGVRVVFAPTNWGCPYDSQGDFNFGFYNQSQSAKVFTSGDGTLTVNGSVTEGPNYPPTPPPHPTPAAGSRPSRLPVR